MCCTLDAKSVIQLYTNLLKKIVLKMRLASLLPAVALFPGPIRKNRRDLVALVYVSVIAGCVIKCMLCDYIS